mgnify:CR=1 FL=1
MTERDAGKYRVGMIGIGRKGALHARAFRLNPKVEIVAAADTDEENLEVFCGRHGVPGYGDYREMLEKEQIDIAGPILPVRPNPGVVIGCAEAGVKGILCEQPLAASLEEADRVVDICRKHDVRIGAGDLNMNLPAYQQAAELIEAGGTVRSCECGTNNSPVRGNPLSLSRFAGFVLWRSSSALADKPASLPPPPPPVLTRKAREPQTNPASAQSD